MKRIYERIVWKSAGRIERCGDSRNLAGTPVLGIVHTLNRLMQRGPSRDPIAHHRYILVASGDRPPGGLMRSHSFVIRAIKNQLGVFVLRQLGVDVVIVVEAEQMRSGNHAELLARRGMIGVADPDPAIRIRY